MRKIKDVSLLKSGIKRIGSFCSRTRGDMLKEDQEEAQICLFNDDDHDDDEDDSCLWLSSSASPSSFFDEGSSCCSSFILDESTISSDISSSSSREVVVDLASWVSELEEDVTFLADLDLEYCCIPSNFPSPSFSTCCSSNREAEVLEEVSELEQLDDDDDDQPALFWPFEEGKLGWNPDEAWISFAMSPRKDTDSTMSSKQPSRCLESEQKRHDHRHHTTARIIPKLRQISSLLLPRRMASHSDSKPVAAATRRAAAANKVILPSRFVKASESSCSSEKGLMKVVPLEFMMAKNRMAHGAIDQACLFESIIGRDEVPIEKVMGLEEFDGHEGIDSSQLDDDLINGDDNLFSLED
ncbi:unnamed protein product [Linum trigynum]|uniref:Uncharacterized protein n=1 Tax=Linum trigynum TaxID=586398 RepID=A0AAV2G4H3_9ROSI